MAEADELLVSNLALIERAVSFVCRRNRMSPEDTEEFSGVVRLKLVENDYAILRKFEGRSTFASYISVVVQRLLLDYRIQLWGKWHPSAEARRLGDTAIEAEKLLRRDGRSIEEALSILRASDPSLDRDTLSRLAERLPPRAPRRTLVALEEVDEGHIASLPLQEDQSDLSRRVSEIVREYLAALDAQDRLVLQLRFDAGMTVADIARSLRIDQKVLYRRVEARLRELRRKLESGGIDSREIANLIGERGVVLDFRLDEVHT